MIGDTKKAKSMTTEKKETIHSCDLPQLLKDHGFIESNKLLVPSVIEEDACAKFGKITYLGKSEKGRPLYVVTDFDCMKANMIGLGVIGLVGILGAGYIGWSLGSSRKSNYW